MQRKQYPPHELFLGMFGLLGGVIISAHALYTEAHPFSAWSGGFMLMFGFGMIELWRLRRKLAQIEAENAELRGETEVAATT